MDSNNAAERETRKKGDAEENPHSAAQTFFAVSPRLRVSVSLIIAASIILVTVLHFLTPLDQIVWHEIYQRLYYIPIIAAALLFGLRGGLAASLFTTLVYIPHIFLHWQHGHFDYSINQYAEIVIFNLVGGIMGALGDRLSQARERAERSAADKQQAYNELQKTFEQLLQAEKLAALGELSAGIVHEVRNPLGSIKGAVEILEDELAPESPRREFADLAKREIERLDKLVGEFLRFARPATLSVKANDLNKIVESVASLIEKQAASQSVVVERELQKKLSKVSVDGEQIKQVLFNLALNSLQAMSKGGRLTFRTTENENFCIVEVRDIGEGIDEKILPKIFDPFFTTKEKGVGLGLSIAHKISVQHGGDLTVLRKQNNTVFLLQLPK
ncbi:MAG TPA: ATP-binding protein [Pyrinomonadaceae bacterium]|nr:ATP-binding protein [Pyrinomonadaceae bacterium]